MHNYQKQLIECGFNPLEAKIYLALLQQNNLKAGEIAKLTDTKRSTTYTTLDTLIEKGVVSTSSIDGIFFFHAEPPITITQYLQKKQQDIAQKLDAMEQLQTELELIKNKALRLPKISIFTGKEGIRTLLSQTLNSDTNEVMIFGEYTLKGDPIPFYTKERVNEKISAKLIAPKTAQAVQARQKDQASLRETFFISEKDSLPASVHISGDKVTLFTHSNNHPIGVLIQDKDIAKTLKTIHEWVEKKLKIQNT